jgi:hypothetical protein
MRYAYFRHRRLIALDVVVCPQNITQAVIVVVVSLRRLRRPGLTKISGIILTGTRCSARRRRRFLSSSSSSALKHKSLLVSVPPFRLEHLDLNFRRYHPPLGSAVLELSLVVVVVVSFRRLRRPGLPYNKS